MFETQRRYTKCVMCGSTDLTREHLFGRGFAKRLSTELPWVTFKPHPDDPNKPNDGKAIMSSVARFLCGDCNSVKFGPEMDRAYPILMSLADGSARRLTVDELSILLRYLQRLGLLVDVATSTEDLDPAYKLTAHFRPNAHWRHTGPVYSPAERLLFATKAPLSPAPRVWIGRHCGVFGIDPETWVNQASKLATYGIVASSKRFLQIIGELAVTIHMGDDPAPFYVPSPSWLRIDDRKTPLTWPPVTDVSYDDILNLLVPDAQILSLKRQLSNGAARSYYERQRIARAGPYVQALRNRRAAGACAGA